MAQLSMRIDDSLRDQFTRMAEENNLSQPQLFAQLMAQAETDELKALVPEQANEIDAVRAHLNDVLEAFTGAVKRSAQAYEIASDKVRGQLEALGTLTNENKRLTDENKQMSLDLAAAQEEVKRLTGELAKVQALAGEVESMRAQLTEARERMVTMREQHQEAITRERRESHEELMEALVRVIKENTKKD